MDYELARLSADRMFAEMSLNGVNAMAAKQASKDVVEHVSGILKPWTSAKAQGEDDLDCIARWYIINAPDKLRKLGVDFAPLESLLGRQ